MTIRLRATAALTGCLLVVAVGGPARASTSGPVVHVNTDEKHNAAHIRGSIDIAASISVVRDALTDCARMSSTGCVDAEDSHDRTQHL